ncbi:MAG: S8 family serine peptidase [Bacteroidota bacterium]
MMRNFLKIIIVLLVSNQFVWAQEVKTYVIYLKDKPTQGFNPYTYFDAKNIERKALAHLPLFDERDLPVNESYEQQVTAACNTVLVASRWLNALFVKATPVQIAQITKHAFVKVIDEYHNSDEKIIAGSNAQTAISGPNKQFLDYQTGRFGAAEFEQKGLTGKGIRIALFDVGFSGADKHMAFEHLRKNNQIKGTYDFIEKETNVYKGGAHGTNTLSCITGVFDGVKMGMATDAEFLLARTEWTIKEDKQEEYFWLAAAEWADKNGAQIISSSLGYGKDWYTVRDMDGKKSVVSFAATVAAQKGILIVNSAGNEYQDSWKTIVTPADADSVLCVGGTNPYTDRHINFSSIGPSADYRIKPNVSAPGHVVAANPNGTISQTFGTSFSCPLTSGFAACAWQGNRSLTNMQLFAEIQKAGHLYPYFDYMHGYGIPQAVYFTNPSVKKATANFKVEQNDKTVEAYEITFTDSAVTNKIVQFQEKEKANLNDRRPPIGLNFYWNTTNEKGEITYYEVITVREVTQLIIKPKNVRKNYTLNFHFEGYTYSKTIE